MAEWVVRSQPRAGGSQSGLFFFRDDGKACAFFACSLWVRHGRVGCDQFTDVEFGECMLDSGLYLVVS